LSEYFDVTTDYLLKGIEREKQAETETDARIFTFITTALNYIGLLVSCAIIYKQEEQDPMAVVIGLIIFTVSGLIFAIGQIKSNRNVAVAKRDFWMVNIWVLAFIPLSAIYNTLLSLPFAPYPLIPDNPFAFPVFILVYIAVCLCVVFMQIKSGRRR
jgi:hypothetical protein